MIEFVFASEQPDFPERRTNRKEQHCFSFADNSEGIQEEVLGNECGVVSEFVDFFQPTTQPTNCDVLHDLQVFWQSPRSCKLLKNLTTLHLDSLTISPLETKR
jgi:hypothetical protein